MNLHTFCFDFIKKNKSWSIANFFLTILNYPLELIVISYLSGQIFSRINNIDKKLNSITFLFILIVITYLVIETLNMTKDLVDAKYYPMMEREVRLSLIDIILKRTEMSFDDLKNGDIIARLLKTPSFVSFFHERLNRWLFPFLMTLSAVMVYLFFLNKRLGAISSASIFIYILIIFLLARQDIKRSEAREKEENILLEELDDTLSNSISIVTCGKLDQERERIINTHNKYDEILKKQLRSSSMLKWVSCILNIILFAIIIGSTLSLYKNSSISNASTIAIITMSIFLVKHLRVLTPRVCETFVYFGTLKENKNFINDMRVDNNDGYIRNLPITGKIEFRSVFFAYPLINKPSLKNITFSINPNDKIGIIGTSGSGKSTIIKLILGFYKPTKGQVLINGVDISLINRKYLRSKISVVTQNVKLFNRTIIENICYGTKYSPTQIFQYIKNLDVMQVFHNLPSGLLTSVGKHGNFLSGGQKQIIYLLRCYFRSNPITILDEPTSNIDSFHKKYIIQMIQELSKKTTLIIVTHDETISHLFNKRIVIEKGMLK